MEFQISTLKQNDAILIVLLLVRLRLLENVSKEFAHALLVATALEIHVGHETLRLRVPIRALEQHP